MDITQRSQWETSPSHPPHNRSVSGRGGELLSNRPEDQEIAVFCLHLIQVSLALITTLLQRRT